MNVTIQEITCKPLKCPREAYLVSENQEEPSSGTLVAKHICYHVRLQDGQEFALDLTGAQYGVHDTLVRWKKYTNMLGFKNQTFEPGGSSTEDYIGKIVEISHKFALEVSRYLYRHIKGCKGSQEDRLTSIEFSIEKLMEDAITEAFFRLDGTLVREGGQAYLRGIQEEQKEWDEEEGEE